MPIHHRRKPEILLPPPNQSVPSAAVEPNLGSKNIRRTLLVGRLQLRLKKTERLRGTSRPTAKVITSANKSRSKPLKKAATRVNAPRTRATPNRISAQVEAQASTGIVADGMNQLSLAVYAMKCEKSPQATWDCPKAPQKPNRSPTAERKETPRASRKNTELVRQSLSGAFRKGRGHC